MKIEKLTLSGFLRFREQVAIDLTAIPEGLVAIVGSNGAGKTTLLEAAPAALYRSFMSRGDLVDYATGRDSFVELQIAVEGHGTYRARVNCDGPKRASDAVLEQVAANGSRRVMNDGKVSTYDQAIARVFPSKDVLLASAFAAQSKTGSFISLDKKGRKQLFAQLLGIERYESMSSTARQAAAFVDQARTRLQALRDVLAQDTSDRVLQEIHTVANDLQADGGRADLRRRTLAGEIAQLEARLATMADVTAAYASTTQRIRQIQSELASRRVERSTVDRDLAGVRETLTTDLRRLSSKRDADLTWISEQTHAATDRADRETRDAALRRDADQAAVTKKLAGNQQILDMGTRIRGAVDQTVALDQRILTLEHEAAGLRMALDEQLKGLSALDRQLAGLETEQQRLDRARQDAALLGSVPCGGAGEFAPCQFLRNAKAAEAQIPALAETVATRPSLQQQAATAAATVASAREQLATFHKQTTELKQQREGLASLTKYVEPLAAAEARITELEAQQAAIVRDFDQAIADAHARRAHRHEELLAQRLQVSENAEGDIRLHQERADAALATLQQRASALDQTIASLVAEQTQAETDLTAADADNQAAVLLRAQLLERREEWDRLTGVLARVDSGRQELQRRRAEVDAKRARLVDVNRRLQRLDDELLDWQTLTKAFSREGLPVLEIDAAGPTISAYTNQLLEVCFGPRFSVDLVTQQAKADGKGMKEDFSIRVLDNTRGGEARDIADLSGGEQVIVAEALSNAICIYVNTRSSMPVRTCWRDETTGALDPENASRYMAMLRKVQELGGFAHILFISHNPDAAAQADAQIQLVDGAASVVFPPYARAEAA